MCRNKDIRMVVTDLDGTLLRRDKTASALTLYAIDELRRRGVIFAVATARPMRSVRVPMPWLSFDAGTFHNGASTWADGRALDHIGIDQPLPLLREILQDHPGAQVCVESGDIIFSNFDTRVLWPREVFTLTPDFSELEGRAAEKIILTCTSPEEMRRYERYLTGELYLQLSENVIAMMMNRRATKPNGVALLAKHYGIPMESVVAFGDDYNDIDMLRACGVGVAVENALPEVKQAADFITCSNEEDGVARWIAENLL